MKKCVVVVLVLILVLMIPLVSLAHSGRTDSDGGHYDRTTGEYHYHHGYGEHQHPNGICPYEYNAFETTSLEYDSGWDDGITEGYSRGLEEGYDGGYEDGYEEGESNGYDEGYDDGYESGCIDSYYNGYEKGWDEKPSVATWAILTIIGLSIFVVVLAIVSRKRKARLNEEEESYVLEIKKRDKKVSEKAEEIQRLKNSHAKEIEKIEKAWAERFAEYKAYITDSVGDSTDDDLDDSDIDDLD